MIEYIVPLIAILSIFVLLPTIIFHYITLWKRQRGLGTDQEHMLEDLWRIARTMERRIETLEQILDHEAPGWRTRK
jgi:phage shock protein B